jgi:hypothetical protein
MGHAYLWVIDVALPAILIIVLIWLVIKVRLNRGNPADRRTGEGTRELYAEEEERRCEGTDEL